MIMSLRPSGMNNQRLDRLIRSISTDVEGDLGYWKFEAHGIVMYCITDETHDRMRVMAPVASADDLDEDMARACLLANFDCALDARYCLNEDTLWGAFLHPLQSLTDKLFESACRQVSEVVKNFGTTYSSGELMFGG